MSSVVVRNEVAETKVVARIVQRDLRRFLNAKARLEKLASMFLASLKLGATVEEGPATAYLDTGSEKRPDWRAALLAAVGEVALAKVRDAAVPKPYERLRVEERKG
jgi:hypothetical protein